MLVIKTSERKAKIKSMPLGENEQILLKPRGIFATRAGDVATGEFYSENIVTKYHKTVEEKEKRDNRKSGDYHLLFWRKT